MIAWIASLTLVACGTAPMAKVAKPPTLGKKCVPSTKSQAEPLLVEWASADRGRLESLMRKGLVAVRYDGCAIAVLPEC